MRKIIVSALVASCILLMTGCSFLKPYQPNVIQGNYLDHKVVNQLHLGMTKNQVQDLLGSPVLNTTFDDNLWSYVYTKQIHGGNIKMTQLNLQFSHEKLARITK